MMTKNNTPQASAEKTVRDIRRATRRTDSAGEKIQTVLEGLHGEDSIADEIVVMYQGGIIEQGPKNQILEPPYADYTELLLSSVPEMDPDWLDDLIDRRQKGLAPTIDSIHS